jgi:hypothetical protein
MGSVLVQCPLLALSMHARPAPTPRRIGSNAIVAGNGPAYGALRGQPL